MKAKRRTPHQQRALQTVQAVLDAVTRILKREGPSAVTTNRIAEVAGVSIGSVYQYFPDKAAIFAALHERHIAEVAGIVEGALAANAAAPLEELVRAMVDATLEAHAKDAELQAALWNEVPHRAEGASEVEARVRAAWHGAIAPKLGARHDADRVVYFLVHLVQALAHAIVSRPEPMPLVAAKEEAARVIVAYVRSSA
jgi:AcrR family transcriptional regulator